MASSTWDSNGSAILSFEPGEARFREAVAPAIPWPRVALTPAALAETIDTFARREGIAAVSLDGPQGWRDPTTPAGVRGVGRRCEYECRTQGKTGVYPQTYPGTQRPWIEFSIELFDLLLMARDVVLASADAPGMHPSSGYVILECFPTSAWRTSGLAPLPAKSKRPKLKCYAKSLCDLYGIPHNSEAAITHDDLQAIVAALTAAAAIGGPVQPEPRGVVASVQKHPDGRVRRVEGLIWDVRPFVSTESAAITVTECEEASTLRDRPTSSNTQARVTQAVLDQVARGGVGQAQIALRGFPRATKATLVGVALRLDERDYELIIGDSHAAWRTHQRGSSVESFESLFAVLSDRPDEWIPVVIQTAPGCLG